MNWPTLVVSSCLLLSLLLHTSAAGQADGDLDWIGIGGGSAPEGTQISMEADLMLARRIWGDRTQVLFGGGRDAPGVQVLDREQRGDPLSQTLGTIFAPRRGRDSTYRRPNLHIDGPATKAEVLRRLQHAVNTPRAAVKNAKAAPAPTSAPPVTLYIAAHGDQGQEPRDNAVLLWGGDALTAAELAAALDALPDGRSVRVVSATCFSGGFAELVFAGGDADKGAAPSRRCGLFATTWDREATGCDPDPDRSRHDGYGVHLLNAMRGRDRLGEPLAAAASADFDGDGHINLREAHARVRIDAQTIDVPVSTSERWLEALDDAGALRGAGGLRAATARSSPTALSETTVLPEERAVIDALSARLGFAPGQIGALEDALRDAAAALEKVNTTVSDLTAAQNAGYVQVAADLLARWPVLDDPWHPDFGQTLTRHRDDIERFLQSATALRRAETLETRLNEVSQRSDVLMRKSALLERLLRAEQTMERARRLRALGGMQWRYFEQLVACERG